MKYNRIVAAGLACALLLSLSVPALAVRKGSGGPRAAGKLDTTQIVPIISGSLTFEGIEARLTANNLTLRAAREGLASAKANDIDKQLKDSYDQLNDGLDALDDSIDQMESAIAAMKSMTGPSMADATQSLEYALTAAEDGGISAPLLASTIAGLSQASAMSAFGTMQAASLEGNLASLKAQRESLEEQLADLKENEKKMKEEFAKTIQDMERQIENAEDQMVAGAESLYLTILSTQLQYDTLKDSLLSMSKTVEEMQLRYDLGQISANTLLQVKNGYATLDNTISGLDTTLSNMRASLQSLLGEVPDGTITLVNTPSVSQAELDAISYQTDLEKAKEKSYTLYSAARSVEKAEDDMDDARKDNGKNSYQYKMAEHAFQSAVYQQSAAIASFELSFQNLYRAISPARATLTIKEADLTYQEQVCAAAELKYKQGNISANSLQEAVNARESARRDVETARLDLFTAYHAYRQAVDKGLTGSGS